MVSYARGDVVSFRITNDFKQGHIDYLKKVLGSKSRTMAKFCANGIALEMKNNIVICGKELPIETREWLSNEDNIHLLITMLRSLQSQDNNIASVQGSEQFLEHNNTNVALTPQNAPEPLEIRFKDNESDELNDFLKQLI